MFIPKLVRALALTAATAVIAITVTAGSASANVPVITLRDLATGFMLDSGPGGDVYTPTRQRGRVPEVVRLLLHVRHPRVPRRGHRALPGQQHRR
jgi:hypothetical protein